jgi:hypothetical protein
VRIAFVPFGIVGLFCGRIVSPALLVLDRSSWHSSCFSILHQCKGPETDFQEYGRKEEQMIKVTKKASEKLREEMGSGEEKHLRVFIKGIG